MRAAKKCFWLLTLVLAFGVAAREAPELARLTEDFSNDGVVVGFEDSIAGLTSRRISAPERLLPNPGRILALVNLKKRSSFIPCLVLSTQAGKGLLLFLSIQRK